MEQAAPEVSHRSRFPPAARMAKVGAGLILLALASTLLNSHSERMNGVSLVWLPNALLIGVLLCAPKRQWPAFLALGYTVDLGVNLAVYSPLLSSLVLSFCNMTEVSLAAALMYKAIAPAPDLTRARQLRSLLLFGVLLAPAIASAMAMIFLRLHDGIALSWSLRFWFAADALGIATVTPLYLSYHQRNRFSRSRLEIASLFLLLCGVTLMTFRVTIYPTMWLVLLSLLLLGMRLGLAGASLGLLAVTFLGGYLTMDGYGPLRPEIVGALPSRILHFQCFIAFSMFALYIIEVSTAARQRVRERLEESESLFRSLAEASRDVIILADLEGSRRYVSPAVTELMGWSQQDLVGRRFGDKAHVDDQVRIARLFQDLRSAAQPGPITFRSCKKDGSYLWLEATARLLREGASGKPHGCVYVLRDISDRKAAEEQMQQAYANVERLATVDGLTGVANRRMLDQTLSQEWARARRDRTPLSLLLIDVDHFKLYNDLYGHLAGDACLQRIASEIQAVLRRPPDLLARYGGEEFVAIMPNTDCMGAEHMAERARTVIELCQMAHAQSAHGVVTVSVGFATAVPATDLNVASLLEAADTALYRAKSSGRNRIFVAGDALAAK